MAQATHDSHDLRDDDEHGRELLRSLLPTLAAVGLLLALLVGGALLLQDLVELGAWLTASE